MPLTTDSVRGHMLLRWMLLGAIPLILIITVFELIHFPGILTPAALMPFYLGIFFVTLSAYVVMALVATRSTSPATDVIMVQALWWGAIIGALWWVEILQANVWRLSGVWLGLLYFGPEIAAYLLPGVAAALATRQTGQMRSGVLVGVLSGMLGAVLTFVGGTVILWICNTSFLHDPQTMQEFLRSYARGEATDIQTFLVGDLLAGLLAHLLLIGIVASALIGIGGAAIGQSLHPASPDLTNQVSES